MTFYDNIIKVSERTLVLNRTYHEDCTTGTIKFPDGTIFHTMELPWKENQNRISCIPEGKYHLGMRRSGVVSRTTGGQYQSGWEVQDVPNRTYIMFHVGNYPSDFEGCVGVGMGQTTYQNGNRMITNSQKAFRLFMEKMSSNPEWEVIIYEDKK